MLSKRSLIFGAGAAIITRPALAFPIPVRNRFAYPAERPGFNPAHPASQGLLLSAAVMGKDLFNLMPGFASSVKGTIVGSPTFAVDGMIGPVINGLTSANYVSFSSTAQSAANCTMAAIFYSPGGTNAGIFGATGGASAGPILTGYAAVLGLTPSATDVASVITIGTGYYFAVASLAFTGGVNIYNYALCNLRTGAIQIATTTQGATIITGGTSYRIGTETEYSTAWPGKIARVMHSSVALTLPQQLAWANDPWSFWQPNNSVLAMDLMAQGSPAAPPPPTTANLRTLVGVGR